MFDLIDIIVNCCVFEEVDEGNFYNSVDDYYIDIFFEYKVQGVIYDGDSNSFMGIGDEYVINVVQGNYDVENLELEILVLCQCQYFKYDFCMSLSVFKLFGIGVEREDLQFVK